MTPRAIIAILLLLLITGTVSADGFSYSYKHVEVDSDIIASLLALFGIEVAPNYIEVTINDQIVAQIPEDSPYVNITIHESCLGNFQYGTRDWFNCEVAYA